MINKSVSNAEKSKQNILYLEMSLNRETPPFSHFHEIVVLRAQIENV